MQIFVSLLSSAFCHIYIHSFDSICSFFGCRLDWFLYCLWHLHGQDGRESQTHDRVLQHPQRDCNETCPLDHVVSNTAGDLCGLEKKCLNIQGIVFHKPYVRGLQQRGPPSYYSGDAKSFVIYRLIFAMTPWTLASLFCKLTMPCNTRCWELLQGKKGHKYILNQAKFNPINTTCSGGPCFS